MKGLMSFMWSLIFLAVTTDSPETHRFISKKEKQFCLKPILTKFKSNLER